MATSSFEKLLKRNGTYSLPYLIYLHDKDKNIELRYVNDTKDITYEDTVFKAGSFSYAPAENVQGFNGGGSLQIAIKDNYVVNLTDNYTSVYLEVIGCINEQGSVTAIKTYKNHYGKVKITKTQATFTFDADDRSQMTFPALIWTHLNNRGCS